MSNSGQFKPGQSGNPAGRPPKHSALADIMREKLEEEQSIIGKDGKKKRIKLKEIFTEKVIQLALTGDIQAVKLIYNYIDGMPKQPHEVSGENGNPIQINFTNSDEKVL